MTPHTLDDYARYEMVLQDFGGHIQRYCIRHAHSADEARELMQEVMAAVWNSIGGLQAEAHGGGQHAGGCSGRGRRGAAGSAAAARRALRLRHRPPLRGPAECGRYIEFKTMKRSTLIILVLSLLLVGSVAVWRFVPRQVDGDEIFHRYVGLEDVCVTYIRDKKVGDSIRVPVVLLEAESERGWEVLDSLFGYTASSEKLLAEIMANPDIPDWVIELYQDEKPSVEVYRAPRNNPERKIEVGAGREDDVTVYIQAYRRRITIVAPPNVHDGVVATSDAIKETDRDTKKMQQALFDEVVGDLEAIDSTKQ